MIALNMVGRVILGLWLVLVGISHWTPLVPVTNGTGLAAELSRAFADSGLTGIASALLIVAGLLILANRLTVLALLAGISVFTAGAYWAILTAEALPILIVAATLGLSVLLLLGYWRYVGQLLSMRATGLVESGAEKNVALRRLTIFSHYLWGGWWIISGLFHFITGPIIGTSPLAVQLIMALLHTGMYELIKAIEAIGGLAVLTRRWAPLLLAINVPITFVVVYWDTVLQDPGHPIGLAVAVLTLGSTGFLLRNYREYLRPLLTWAPRSAGR
ncbi:hypothetical protein [Sphingomonas profundi]|uniref:hypothetical protein n=1 Tax=Alterirhizorhabdus profundi TaxID=2681549 RepID=UPI0012E80B80|nr:hypothetical protein [Sphingomonas profundi]